MRDDAAEVPPAADHMKHFDPVRGRQVEDHELRVSANVREPEAADVRIPDPQPRTGERVRVEPFQGALHFVPNVVRRRRIGSANPREQVGNLLTGLWAKFNAHCRPFNWSARAATSFRSSSQNSGVTGIGGPLASDASGGAEV